MLTILRELNRIGLLSDSSPILTPKFVIVIIKINHVSATGEIKTQNTAVVITKIATLLVGAIALSIIAIIVNAIAYVIVSSITENNLELIVSLPPLSVN